MVYFYHTLEITLSWSWSPGSNPLKFWPLWGWCQEAEKSFLSALTANGRQPSTAVWEVPSDRAHTNTLPQPQRCWVAHQLCVCDHLSLFLSNRAAPGDVFSELCCWVFLMLSLYLAPWGNSWAGDSNFWKRINAGTQWSLWVPFQLGTFYNSVSHGSINIPSFLWLPSKHAINCCLIYMRKTNTTWCFPTQSATWL